ncbi:MAG: diphosphate--fructose-6-phosphate 1-phosphotransferase [Candidatus Sumerlaeota bacterium]|nr:diphosphate--fructose-6-phosphate 1-phosphotransferase [Candidatus Sumerlaeota bacterium]
MSKIKGALVVVQGGGPTQVINASLYGVVKEALGRLDDSAEILGARHGIMGVLNRQWWDLRRQPEALWEEIRLSPGSALGSSRKMLNAEEADEAVRILNEKAVRYLACIGGNDSMDTANKLAAAAAEMDYDLQTAGIPKTIDNDLPHTDHCPGFGSAARYIAQSAIDLGTDVGTLPTPISIMEVMGRNAGWLTAATMAARQREDDAPHLIYVPETPLEAGRFLDDIQAVYTRQGWVVAAVSEGLKDEKGKAWSVPRSAAAADEFGHVLPGDVATTLAGLVSEKLKLRARSEKPGLLGRSSRLLASEVDRREAEQVGRFGLAWMLDGHSSFMAAIRRESDSPYQVSYFAVPLREVANVERTLPLDYLTPERNQVRETFRAYVEPLIGGALIRHARLRDGVAQAFQPVISCAS